MKNNILKEVKHIKHLMGLNENSNDDCEKQLEDDGYVVYNRTELQKRDDDCGDATGIKCVIKWLVDNGFDKSTYRTSKHGGICYLSVRSDDTIDHDGVNIKKRTWTFWENGDVTYIRTFDVVQIDVDTPTIKYSQVQFKGKYECDNTELKYTNLKYQGVYKLGNTSSMVKITGDFDVKKPNGYSDGRVKEYAVTNSIMTTTDFY